MSWLEEKISDLMVFFLVFFSFSLMFIIDSFLPQYRTAGQAIFFAVLLAYIPLSDYVLRERTNPYNCLRSIIRPVEKEVSFFIKNIVSRRIPGFKNRYNTYIELAFPVKLEDYGKVNSIIVQHYGEFEKRVKFKPGWTRYAGMSIKHPQVARVVLWQNVGSTTAIDHGSPIPIFSLRDGPQDYYQAFETAYSSNPYANGGVNISNLMERISNLEIQLAESRRESQEWHQKCLAYEEIIEQQKAEIRGLTEGKTSYKDVAYEVVLTLLEATSKIDHALQKIRGPRISISFNKWMAITIIALASITYLYLNPSLFRDFSIWLSSPLNQLFFLITLVVIIAIMYYFKVKK